MTRYRQLATVVVALALGATACGGNGGSTGNNQQGSNSTGAGGNAADAIYQASDKAGGTLELAIDDDCDSWDAQRTYYGTCWNFQRFISRGLLTYAPKPGKAGTEVVPDLATEVPTSPDGGKTWTYKLKDNIKFEDGTPITSKDVKYGIERVFAADVINGGPTYVVDELEGGDTYKGPYADKAGLKSIETPDDKTITFKLKRAFSDWNFVMASPTSTPVPQAKDTKDKYAFKPVSSGPYKFEKYSPGKELTLVRNESWDKATDQVRKALPDRVHLTMGLDPADIDQKIMANEVDVDMRGTGIQVAAQGRAQSDPAVKKRTFNVVQPTLRYLTVFQANKPFDNVNCRNAVSWVLDKKGQQIARGGDVNGGQIAGNMSPPSLQYSKPFDVFPTPENRGDVAKAKEELVKCGQPNGFKTKIATRSGKEAKQAEALQADLKKIGIEASISQFPAAGYYRDHLQIPANVRREGIGLAFASWSPDWAAPYGFYHFIVDGRQILPKGNSNYGELNDPVVNKAMDDALAATDDAERAKQWETVDRKVVESGVYVPLMHDKVIHVHSERLTNAYITDGYAGEYDYVNLGVTP